MSEYHRRAKALLSEIALRLQRMIYGGDPLGDTGDKMRWQDISTAPKDGRAILVCRAIDADGKPMGGELFGLHVQRVAWLEDDWFTGFLLPDEPGLFFEPTHWMPIPPPPEV